MNRAIPKPIIDAGYKKFEIADEKLNPLIAHQFEELFLINKSGPFVTEAISTLYDLNDINDADILCQKKLRASKNLLKTRNVDAETLNEKIKKYAEEYVICKECGKSDTKIEEGRSMKKVLRKGTKVRILKSEMAEDTPGNTFGDFALYFFIRKAKAIF